MRTTRARTTDTRPARRGFTIVELLVTISIIAILMSLLVVAVSGGFGSASFAQVRTEISNFDAAIADFKVQYGTEPPSSITIPEDGASWTPDARSKIRSVFGTKVDFTAPFDLNGDGDTSDTHVLNGEQCLLFFLGGPLRSDGAPYGFSKNPRTPFETTSGGNRAGPFFEIDVSRVVVDTAGQYPHYEAPNDYGRYLYVHSDEYSPSVKAYLQTASTYWQPKSFQIICSGPDRNYGATLNPVYDPDNSDALDEADRDNVTNFSNGRLGN